MCTEQPLPPVQLDHDHAVQGRIARNHKSLHAYEGCCSLVSEYLHIHYACVVPWAAPREASAHHVSEWVQPVSRYVSVPTARCKPIKTNHKTASYISLTAQMTTCDINSVRKSATTQADQGPATELLTLPDHVLEHITSQLHFYEAMYLAQTCHKLHKLFNNMQPPMTVLDSFLKPRFSVELEGTVPLVHIFHFTNWQIASCKRCCCGSSEQASALARV